MCKNKCVENELLSVIIPVYNTEKYLDRCISSVLSQTYTNLEVIVINDGSTDNSLEICRKWENADSRVVLINKKNAGVSDSRNRGLEAAKGKYIGFVDSDDYIEENMYEELINSMKHNNTDLVTCGVSFFSETTQVDGLNEYPELPDKHFFLESIREGEFLFNKLMKKEIIGDLRFYDKIRYAEDVLFLFEYTDKIDKISTVNKVLYNYNTCNESSITHSITSVDYMKKIEAGYYIMKILEKNDIDTCEEKTNMVCNYVIHKKNIGKNFDYSKYDQIVKEYMNNGLLFKIKGGKNKTKLFLAYYLKGVFFVLRKLKDKKSITAGI